MIVLKLDTGSETETLMASATLSPVKDQTITSNEDTHFFWDQNGGPGSVQKLGPVPRLPASRMIWSDSLLFLAPNSNSTKVTELIAMLNCPILSSSVMPPDLFR